MDKNSEILILISILEKEKEQYDALLKTLKEKQSAVIQGSVESLRNLITKEKKVAKDCAMVANERVNFINEYCDARKIKAHNIPLKDFIGFSDEPEKNKMENVRYALINILTEIKQVNRQNETLLHFSINHVQKMTRIFLHSTSEEMNMYDYFGKKYNKEINQKFVNHQI